MTRVLFCTLTIFWSLILQGQAWGGTPPGQIHLKPVQGLQDKATGGISAEGFNTVVAIYFDQVDRATYICSGILITEQLVLTAGHCGCGIPGTYRVNYSPDARQENPATRIDVDLTPILFDQRVCRGIFEGGNDLALLHLAEPAPGNFSAPLSMSQPPKPLPQPWPGFGFPPQLVFDWHRTIRKSMRLKAVGYGYTETHVIGVRMQTDIPVFTFDCIGPDFAGVCSPLAEMILAEAPGPRIRSDTCGGDSGGPVFVMTSGKPTLVAITSRAAPGVQDDIVRHCGGGGIYSLIGRNSVHNWLSANGVPLQN